MSGCEGFREEDVYGNSEVASKTSSFEDKDVAMLSGDAAMSVGRSEFKFVIIRKTKSAGKAEQSLSERKFDRFEKFHMFAIRSASIKRMGFGKNAENNITRNAFRRLITLSGKSDFSTFMKMSRNGENFRVK